MSTNADIPHFDQPFRFTAINAVVVEQDSPEDIVNCVVAILHTEQGERTDLPDFGIVSPAFETYPIDVDSITNDIIAQEPRAVILIDQGLETFDELINDVLVTVDQVQTDGADIEQS